MRFLTRNLLPYLLLFVILFSCIQVILYTYQPDSARFFDAGLVLVAFTFCASFFVNSFLFRYLYVGKSQRPGYFLSALLTGLVFALLITQIISVFGKSETDGAHLLRNALAVYFVMFGGMAFNYVIRSLLSNGHYFENQAIVKQMEVDHLKNQLNPHFLFNSLNNVAATIQVDTELALNYVYTLSSLLRYQIESSGKEYVTLAEENLFLESFLGIEELRLGDRCDLNFESEIENPLEKLPPLLLHPFVEDVIRKSCSSGKPGKVKITLHEKNHRLVLVTSSSVMPGYDAASEDHLLNASKRLKIFYPSAFKIDTEITGNMFQTTLTIDLGSYKRINLQYV